MSAELPEWPARVIEGIQERAGRNRAGYVIKQMPAGVPVGPVETPFSRGMTQLRDRAARPLGPGVPVPGPPRLHDRHRGPADIALDTDLVTGGLGDSLLAPTGDLPQVSIGDWHPAILAPQLRSPTWLRFFLTGVAEVAAATA
jgi:hypothetical protein